MFFDVDQDRDGDSCVGAAGTREPAQKETFCGCSCRLARSRLRGQKLEVHKYIVSKPVVLQNFFPHFL